MGKKKKKVFIYVCVYIYIYMHVKLLIASKISFGLRNVYTVYIYILSVYKYKHMYIFKKNILCFVCIFIYNIRYQNINVYT